MNTTKTKDRLTDELVHALSGVDIPTDWPVRNLLGEKVYDACGAAAAAMIRSLGRLTAERVDIVKRELEWVLQVIDEQLGTSLAEDYVARSFEREGMLRIAIDDLLQLQRAIAYGTAAQFVVWFWALYDPIY